MPFFSVWTSLLMWATDVLWVLAARASARVMFMVAWLGDALHKHLSPPLFVVVK